MTVLESLEYQYFDISGHTGDAIPIIRGSPCIYGTDLVQSDTPQWMLSSTESTLCHCAREGVVLGGMNVDDYIVADDLVFMHVDIDDIRDVAYNSDCEYTGRY